MPEDHTQETQVNLDASDMENHAANKFFVNLQNALAEKLPEEGLPKRSDEIAEIDEDGAADYSYYPEGLEYAEFIWSPEEDTLTVYIVAKKPGWKRADADPILQEARGAYELDYEGKNFFYYFETPMTANDLADPAKLAHVADEAANLYKAVKAAQKTLAQKRK